MGTFSDGSMQNLTSQAAWISSSTRVATINTNGLAMGISATDHDPLGITSRRHGQHPPDCAARFTFHHDDLIDQRNVGRRLRGNINGKQWNSAIYSSMADPLPAGLTSRSPAAVAGTGTNGRLPSK